MNVLEKIHDEHVAMGALFQAFEMLLDEVRAGKTPDYKLLANMLDYIIREPEEMHHPKEDKYLFPLLVENDPLSKELVDQLETQHVEGKKHIGSLSQAFVKFYSIGIGAFNEFDSLALSYIKFANQHIVLEEKELLPRARMLLNEDDLTRLGDLYNQGDDKPDGDFRNLFKVVANKLPAPLGLGKRWL